MAAAFGGSSSSSDSSSSDSSSEELYVQLAETEQCQSIQREIVKLNNDNNNQNNH